MPYKVMPSLRLVVRLSKLMAVSIPGRSIRDFFFLWRIWNCDKAVCRLLHSSPVSIIPPLPGCWQVLSLTRKEICYRNQTLTFASHSKKKKLEVCPPKQVSAAAMTSASDEKWRPFHCLFQSGRAKDLSAPLYPVIIYHSYTTIDTIYS